MPQIDTRLVQTAVIGGRDSDQPVILPEEPHNLDEFRRQFGTDRFWCGTLLGGCGEKLMTKRYETKVCHFSHYPDRQGNRAMCHRSENGVDSADHLFIKLHVTRWLADQGHAARAELRSLGHGPGDAVDFWLRATEQHLRFELHLEDYRSWRKAADSLGAKEGHIEWVFGSDGAITRDMVARQGYALRVRCETEGNDRRVLIGTVTENRPVAWEALEHCRMTSHGLVTPALEELRDKGIVREGGMRNNPLPGSLPLRGAEIVFAVDAETKAPTESPFRAAGRYLVSGFVKPAGSRIIRAHLSLPDAIPLPTEQYVYQLSGVVRLLITDPVGGNGSAWAVRADNLVQLNGLDAERTGLWRPSVALEEQLDTAPRQLHARSAPAPAQSERSRTATALRKQLERVAREGATTTWHELARQIGLDLAHLPDPKRRDLLVEVDKPLSPDRPLLCVLILAGSGRHLPYLGTVLRLLGAAAPASEAALQRWSTNAIKKAHEAYSRAPALATSATRHDEPTLTTDTPRRADLLAASQQRVSLRAKLREAAAVLPRASGRRITRLTQAIEQGEAHDQTYDAACRQGRTLRAWLRAGDAILRELDRVVGRPIVPLEPAPQSTISDETPSRHATTHDGGSKGSSAVEQGKRDPQVDAARSINRISELFGAAKSSGDLAGATRLRQEAGNISGRRLTEEVRQRLQRLRADIREWVDARESEQAHDALRVLLDELAAQGTVVDTLRLRSGLAHAKILKRRCHGSLPEDIQAAFDALQGQLEGKPPSLPPHEEPPSVTADHQSDSLTEPARHTAFVEARDEFEWLVHEIRAAQEAGDLAAVETARRLAGPVYARRLSASDREKHTPFMREVKEWCRERDPEKQVDPSLRKIRQLLAELGRNRDPRSAVELADALDEIGRLSRQRHQPLPAAEDREVKRWRHRLKDLRLDKREHAAPSATAPLRNAAPRLADGIANDPRHADRLPIETVEKLATAVREILADAARSGGKLLTWGDLRLRMAGGLPRLHPDDQGELLVAVDRETPTDEPLLSTLITSADASLHWLYRHVRFSLGRERILPSELEGHWATEVLRLRQLWRHR